MTQEEKDIRIREARQNLLETQEKLSASMRELDRRLEGKTESREEIETEELRMLQSALDRQAEDRLQELHKLHPAPYFQRCDVHLEGDESRRELYIGKFAYDEAGIISWTAPAAGMRFDQPGPVRYLAPGEGVQSGTLERKDQFMIAEGKIVFLASEELGRERELVYQEYLSNRRGGFALPEIVAQMEKAQDEVIRADHRGPFAISGPAGSGKTTLALHRVAYLTQAPDVAKPYPSHSVIVFVQDTGTQDYFSHLLPELGINNVKITTFSAWAMDLLELEGHSFVPRIGGSPEERDAYEYAKAEALRSFSPGRLRAGSVYSYLEGAYGSALTEAQSNLLERQRLEQTLDRYDLTALLMGAWAANPGFSRERQYSIRLKDGRTKLENRSMPLRYPLIVVDEFQNYLPAQLRLLRRCLNPDTQAILYVGDMAQQTSFGTVREWSEIGETVAADRQVKLYKVYRNTKQILRFIRSLGYQVEIPEGIKEGPEVELRQGLSPSEETAYVAEIRSRIAGSVGVLARDAGALEAFRNAFGHDERVRCMTMQEAQGVEFDAVVLVGIEKLEEQAAEETSSNPYLAERQRIERDILYVALTRAMSELHILKW